MSDDSFDQFIHSFFITIQVKDVLLSHNTLFKGHSNGILMCISEQFASFSADCL